VDVLLTRPPRPRRGGGGDGGHAGGSTVEVRVWWTPAEVEPGALHGRAAAVVDSLRATTSIAAALASGAAAVVPFAEEDAARAWAAEHAAVLAGERACVPPPGFDLGNSPEAFTPDAVAGREIAFWTTNGSRALSGAAAGGGDVVAFALVNARAVARHLRQSLCRRLGIVCAGTEGAFSLEDAFTAGALIDRLADAADGPPVLDERAAAAHLLYLGGQGDPRGIFDGTAAAAKIRARGLGADVAFAARPDVLDVVPFWRDGALRPAMARH